MAATKLQANWSAVGFTPSGGSLTPITKVRSVSFDNGGSLAPHSADTDRFPTTILALMTSPKSTIVSGDVAALQGLAPGTVGAVSATFKDAKLAALGDIVYAGANAVVENSVGGGEHANYGEATVTFQHFSADGTTHPISFTRV